MAGRAVRGLGAQRRAGERGRGLQQLGRPLPSHAGPPRLRGVGAVHPRPGAGGPLQVRAAQPRHRAGVPQDRPLRPAFRAAAPDRRRGAPARPFPWSDAAWMERRAEQDWRTRPCPSTRSTWVPGSAAQGEFLNYRELARRLVDYVSWMGFTHLELMPVDRASLRSVLGLPGHRLLRPHQPLRRRPTTSATWWTTATTHGIGVLLDWVPAHFPKDAHALARFDGTPLYEHEDPRLGEHQDWSTLIFNFGRHEVKNFLLSSAMYWLRGAPRGRPAGGRRGLDALPGLFAQGGRMDAQPLRRPRKPGGHRLPARTQRGGARASAPAS